MTVTALPRRMQATHPKADEPCTCAHKRALHDGGAGTGRCLGFVDVEGAPPCECAKFRLNRRLLRALAAAGEDPKVAIQAYDAARPRSSKTARARAAGKWGVGPSDLSACRRAVQYRERPPDDLTLNEVDKSAAYLGSMLDEGWKRARRRRYPWRRFSTARTPFVVDIPGLDVPGEPDEFDPYIGRVTDYKTAGEWAWERIAEFGPFDDMWDQALVYGLGLEDAGHKVTEVEIIVINVSGRNNGTSESHVRRYDRQAALAAVSRLHATLEGLDAGIDLPRDRRGPSLDPICARYCPFRDYCWEVPAAEAAGRSPESWVLVKDDEAVAGALMEYTEARAEEKLGKERKETARAMLQGVEAGQYGPNILRWKGGGSTWAPDKDERIHQLERALEEAAPGRLVNLPYPEKKVTSSVSIDVRPVRKAELDRVAAEAAVQDEAV